MQMSVGEVFIDLAQDDALSVLNGTFLVAPHVLYIPLSNAFSVMNVSYTPCVEDEKIEKPFFCTAAAERVEAAESEVQALETRHAEIKASARVCC
jgi:hypothetical protein